MKATSSRDFLFGDIPGYPRGTSFADRKALHKAGVHTQTQGGISSRKDFGANSIVLSGGYKDDKDYGDHIIYTGQGGQDGNGRQIADQTLTAGNLGLTKSRFEGLPVRVIRGHQHRSNHSPPSGYRYDGLFRVDDSWHEEGQDGFLIWRFKLVQMDDADEATDALTVPGPLQSDTPATRVPTTTQRIVRSSLHSRTVKKLYGHQCQVCGIRLSIPSGHYSEGAHIRPLGRPHNGTDATNNILCLCPNDHVRFDSGAIHVSSTFMVVDSFTEMDLGPLQRHPQHEIASLNFEYHRQHIASGESPSVAS